MRLERVDPWERIASRWRPAFSSHLSSPRRSQGKHIITSQIEHPAVTAVCERLRQEGFEITYLPVDEYGLVSVSDVRNAVRPETILITLMHANNEVGTIQPVEDVARLANSQGIVFHTDDGSAVRRGVPIAQPAACG